MAKRRNKNKNTSPNLPESTLERARKQIQGELDEGEGEVPSKIEAAKPVTPTASESEQRARRSRRQAARRQAASNPASGQFSNRPKRDNLSSEYIAELLANPTKTVTEEQLHEEYGYVLADLRSMGILTAALMVLLVGLAQFI